MSQITPMMQQYLAARKEAQKISETCLLFYRMGDFYELFFEDAITASEALDIALTKRGNHDGADIPMCGVPVHAAETYLSRLIRKGFRVAIAEQMETPAEAKKRGSKSLVRRDIIRVITPGTLTDDALLSPRNSNYLIALTEDKNQRALAWCDMSTGAFSCAAIGEADLDAELARLNPTEVLIPLSLKSILPPALLSSCVIREPHAFEKSLEQLKTFYDIRTLDGLGFFSPSEVRASATILTYLEETQRGLLPRLSRLSQEILSHYMRIDSATRTNLELLRSMTGEREGSLLHSIDRTLTNAGSRLLSDRLAAPLTAPLDITERLDVVDIFYNDGILRTKIRQHLKKLPDIERILSRFSLARGTPRDLGALRDAMIVSAEIKSTLHAAFKHNLPPALKQVIDHIGSHGVLAQLLSEALAEELPLHSHEGGFIAKGYDDSLDALRSLSQEGYQHIANCEAQYREQTGLANLKIRHNNIIGYHIDVTPKSADVLLADKRFIHRQTLANSVRFSTQDLNILASKIEQSKAQSIAREEEHFTELKAHVRAEADALSGTAHALAQLDVASALADHAIEKKWVRPIVDQSLDFNIEHSRHPVVEEALYKKQALFVPNDCLLQDAQRLWLITGPNMAGKSTFLRQNALIAVLAQMGSFVPAKQAKIGVVDRLFSRVGASDDLASGRSTFMVEMVETAAILNQAGPRALVVLDEVGRGTATYDGLAIAWACLEHLHDVNQCRALFATHYHELTVLSDRLQSLALYTVKVKPWQDSLVFLHEIIPGAADRSYGLQVAKMAGVPQMVLTRAQEVLNKLEKGGDDTKAHKIALNDLPLFSIHSPPSTNANDALRDALREIKPDELTPRAALDALYHIKTLL